MRVKCFLFAALLAFVSATDLSAQNTNNPSSGPATLNSDGDASSAAEKTMEPVIVRPEGGSTQSGKPAYEGYGEEGFGNGGDGYGYGGNGNGGTTSWSSGAYQSFGQRVGSYNQPVWTTQRPFTTTRAYVLPAHTYEFEQWVRPTWDEGEEAEWRMLEEVALGLGCRVQLDIYERWNIEPDDDGSNNQDVNHEGVQIEMRYALADWGCIPLNPTLYAEWIERGGPQDKPNKFETKLLLSDELTPCLFAASNVILEQEVAGELETEIGWNNAIGAPVIDGTLMAGIESEFSATTVKDNRSDAEYLFAIGPSLQLRPTPRQFIDIVGLFGTTDESYLARMYLVWGYQFGSRAGPSGGYRGTAATRGD